MDFHEDDILDDKMPSVFRVMPYMLDQRSIISGADGDGEALDVSEW